MSKRELSRLIGPADVEGSRSKRRRDAITLPKASSDVDVTMSEVGEVILPQNGDGSFRGSGSLKELGLHLLQTVKEAKAKDGRQLALAFLTKPPRKVYPDYYQLIKTPIALDDIKKRLDTNAYPTLHVLLSDFELLYSNAMEYNMKDSVIWKDAKDMLKLVQKAYEKLAPLVEADDGSDDDDEKKGKFKEPNLNRIIKSRLQKLIEKTDKDGRTMSTEFMQLPNKKQWPLYYQQIKNPRCIENIFKKIKRRDYHTSAAFASDVELVFSNAMTFNQTHSVIWDDALALRDYFRQLMSDLPPPHNLPEYSSNKIAPNKIRIKPPVAPSAAQSDSTISKQEPSPSALLLRVPAANSTVAKASQPISASSQVKAKPAATSTLAATPSAVASASTTSATAAPAKAPIAPQPQRPAQQPLAPATQATKSASATPQPLAAAQQATFTYSHYYQPLPPPAPAPSTTPITSAAKATPAASSSPAPLPIHPNHQIKYVKMRVQPRGRLFWLDHREGVKTWVMRLVPGETGIDVDDLVFVGDDEGEESSDEEDEEDFRQEDEEDEMEIDGSTSSPKNSKTKKGKVAVRRSQRAAAVTTRTTRSAVAKNRIQEQKKEAEKVEEALLKLDGAVVKEKEDATRQWNVSLSTGSHILEVGEKDGLMWKVYIERMAD
ncbi:hypothetical protein D9756_005882 [Leucocoprinus leucothites]|uniref:Bromo domain-containing protein n=1 Tax=Leucocoprinus leucothites TaxID=201217 RepID=A0A8H5D4E8_9AGAR|nr:hypothetical protein D9756_005882 [Leucoagaricus leucothites]